MSETFTYRRFLLCMSTLLFFIRRGGKEIKTQNNWLSESNSPTTNHAVHQHKIGCSHRYSLWFNNWLGFIYSPWTYLRTWRRIKNKKEKCIVWIFISTFPSFLLFPIRTWSIEIFIWYILKVQLKRMNIALYFISLYFPRQLYLKFNLILTYFYWQNNFLKIFSNAPNKGNIIICSNKNIFAIYLNYFHILIMPHALFSMTFKTILTFIIF